MRRRLLPAGVAVLAIGSSFVLSQQREAEDPNRVLQAHEPGGTDEKDLWRILVLVGIDDSTRSRWDGGVAVENGEIHAIDGYRFTPPDRILPQGGWKLETQPVTIMPKASLASDSKQAEQLRIIPKGIWIQGSGSAQTRLLLTFSGESLPVQPAQLAIGDRRRYLGGRLEIQRVPAVTDLSGTELRQHDSPALACSRDGALWSVWESYHDRRQELNLRLWKDDRWSRLIPVARAAEDLWNPQVAVDSDGKPWLIWSQQIKGNWDVYAMRRESHEEWGELVRLSDGALAEFDVRVASSEDGAVYVVWQAITGRTSQINMRYLRDGRWSAPIRVTNDNANNWEPAVAVGSNGVAWIVWDRYTTDYDVFARSFSPASGLSPEMRITSSARFEAHASVAVDSANRPWIAWETGGVNWGKDLGMALGGASPGTALGESRRIEVVCRDGNQWKAPAAFAPRDSLSEGSTGESAPRLIAAPDGALWMGFKRRFSFRLADRSSYWESYLVRLAGTSWEHPIPLPESWSRSGARLGLAVAAGRLWAFWPQEARRFPFASRPRNLRVLAGSAPLAPPAELPRLEAYRPAPDESMPAGHTDETEAVSRMRSHRVTIAGTPMQVLRGDLHRHTELSQDMGGIGDGSMQEFYRYVIDAAELDFGASTDHQAGGIDYWNNVTLNMADLYHLEGRFVALYGYERNMPAPHGHRNIFHSVRDYRILPFFQRISPRFLLPDTPDSELVTQNSADYGGANEDDTRLLYEELRKSGGLAIPHTTAGANRWLDNDPALDPVMEIYQGARDSSEHQGAPRSRNKSDFGYAWDAWNRGYRVGVIASSDHFSTHISYGMVYAPTRTREALLDAIRQRHTYGATDNILLEFWMGDRFMGDDFAVARPQEMRIRVRGTADVQSVQLIRDAKYIHEFSPGKRDVDLTYLDREAAPGQHWYYVRVQQRDGQLAWSSPIWVQYQLP